MQDPIFFPSAAAFRDWLAANHATATEVLFGFWRIGAGRTGPTWAEAVEEALCFGWIDGVRRSIDAERYLNRFTPRRPGSIWSPRNLATIERLTAEGRMHPAGLAVFEARRPDRVGLYASEQEGLIPLAPALEAVFVAAVPAWGFFNAQPGGYQKTIRHWVMSAKQEATRLRRLARVIEASAAGERIDLAAPFGRGADSGSDRRAGRRGGAAVP